MKIKYPKLITILIISSLVISFMSFVNIEKFSDEEFKWNLPKDINPPVVPDYNPMTQAKVELGRYLFYDKKLSSNQTQSCSSCHLQEFAFADHNSQGIGSTGVIGRRNPNSLTNTAFYSSYSWANPSLGTLESFNILPIINDDPVELGADNNLDEVVDRFKNDPSYDKLFKDAFPDEHNLFSLKNIVYALSSFTRTLNSFNSSFDKYQRGDKSALSESQIKGMELFMSEKANCSKCHSGIHFSDATKDINDTQHTRVFHNIGLYNLNDDSSYTDMNQGLFEVTQQNEDKGKFKTPSLRNIELTYPYMHDGSVATLEEVIDIHSVGGRIINIGKLKGDGTKNVHKDKLIFAKQFSEDEKKNLVNFLKSLTDREFITNKNYSDPFTKR